MDSNGQEPHGSAHDVNLTPEALDAFFTGQGVALLNRRGCRREGMSAIEHLLFCGWAALESGVSIDFVISCGPGIAGGGHQWSVALKRLVPAEQSPGAGPSGDPLSRRGGLRLVQSEE